MYEKKISLKTLYLLGIICAGLAFLGVGSTYAVFVAEDTISNPISFVSNLSYDGNVIETIEVTVGAGETISTTLNITNNGTSSINYVVWHNNKNDNVHIGLNSGTVSGTLTSGTTSSPVVDIRNKTDESLKLILGISSGTGSVVLSGDMYVVPSEKIPPYLVEYINNLYTPNSTATNNEIVYNLDTTNYLMNDRLGGVETLESGVGNIRYYGANPNNYVDIGDVYKVDTTIDNFKENAVLMSYFGIENSASCYEFFDCKTNYSNISLYSEYIDVSSCETGLKFEYGVDSVDELCGTEEKKVGEPKLYRIIGLFNDVELSDGSKQDLIKVVREGSIGNFAYDFTGISVDDLSYDNNWHDSTLMTILNNGYYNASNSIFHYYFDIISQLNSSFKTDLSVKGLNSNIKNKIESVVWNLGGWDGSYAYSNNVYIDERGDGKCDNCTYETIWPGKIALMYPSDYGYATDFKACSESLDSYGDSYVCLSNDWLVSNPNLIEWLLTPFLSQNKRASVFWIGYIYSDEFLYIGNSVRPSFYLTANVSKMSGSGTKRDPYIIN